MKRIVLGLVIIICALAASPARAHDIVVGVGTRSIIVVHPDRVQLDINLGYSATAGLEAMRKMDGDFNFVIEPKEVEPFLMEIEKKLLAKLTLKVDGRPVAITALRREAQGVLGPIQSVQFDTWFYAEARPEGLGPGEHTFEFQDDSFADTLSQQRILVPYIEHTALGSLNLPEPRPEETQDAYQIYGRSARFVYEFAAASGKAGGGVKAQGLRQTQERDPKQAEATEDIDRTRELVLALKAAIDGRGLSLWLVLSTSLIAMFYGALHALLPGHGKATVTAFLLGSQGRVIDALHIGLIVTATHTATAYLLGAGFWALRRLFLPDLGLVLFEAQAITWLGLGSGLFIALFGLLTFLYRIRHRHDGHDHGHDHHHDHGHHHHHDHRSANWALGLSAGIMPCPAALGIVIITAPAPGLIPLLGFFVLTAFSLGLGALMVAIAVAVVTGKGIFLANQTEKPWTRALPVLSPLVVCGVGIYIAILAYDQAVKNGVI